MATIDAIDITSLNFQEGSAPGTPSSTQWKVYAKTDGLYVIDDAGTETGPLAASSGGGGGISSGTSMPGSPSTNDRFYRTDLELVFHYDGTRWVTDTLFREFIGNATITATGVQSFRVPTTHETGLTLWLVAFYASTNTATTNDGTKYYTLDFRKLDTANSATTVASFDTSADTVDVWTNHRVAIGAVLTPATSPAVRVEATKTSTPGSCTGAFSWGYRLIGT